MNKNSTAWSLVAIASLLYIYDYILRVSPCVLSAGMIPWLGVDALQWSLIHGMFYYGYALMQIPSGMVIDHYGVRRPLIIGCFVSALCACAPLCFKSIEVMMLSRFIMGMSASLAYIAPMVIARRYLPVTSFALAGGFIQVLGSVGAITGTSFVLSILNAFGLYQTLLVIAGIGLLITLIFFIYIPHDPHEKSKKPLQWSHEWTTFKYILSMKTSYIAGFIALSLWCPIIIFLENWGMTWLTLIGHSESFAVNIMTLGWVTLAIGGPLSGWLSAHYQTRRKILITALCFNITGSILWLLAPQYLLLSLIAVPLFSLGASAQCVTFGIIADTNTPDRIGTAIGFNNMLITISGFTMLPLVGYWIQSGNLSETSQSLVQNFIMGQSFLILLLLGAISVAYFALKETYRSKS